MAGAFMQRLGPAIDVAFGRPRAIVTVSAHTAARVPVVLAAPRHEAIYDFGGFDPKLRTLRYDAAGDPALAARILRAAAVGGNRRAEGRPGRARPRRLDRAALPLPGREHPDRPARVRSERPAGGAVRARRGARAAGARRRARPRQRQHHAQPAPPVRERAASAGRPARARRQRRVSPLDRRARAGAGLERALRLPQPGAARGRHASDRRAPAAVVRRRRGRRARRRAGAHPRQRDDGQPRHGRVRLRPRRRHARQGARARRSRSRPDRPTASALSVLPARCRRRLRRASPSS